MNCDLRLMDGCAHASRKSAAAMADYSAAVQEAGAIYSAPRQWTQVVDISSRTARIRVVSGLISRRLRRKSAFFGPFLSCKWIDFSPVTKNLPDFLIFKRGRGKLRVDTEGRKRCQPQMTRMAQIGMVEEVDSDGEAWEKSELNRIVNIIYMNRAIMVLLVSL